MIDQVLASIYALNPTQFENLVYEVLISRGLENVVWRTPGADGGRDIEGTTFDRDLSGATEAKKWYVECKRHKTTLDWPTVRGKISYAESNDADFLLIATTATPSPQCENEIEKWNRMKRRPQVRFWRGYDLPNIIRAAPRLAAMFGLAVSDEEKRSSLIPLAEVVTKVAQAGFAQSYFGTSTLATIETSAALAELFSVRLKDLQQFGRAAKGPGARSRLFDWLETSVDLSAWEETALRAIISFLRYEFQAQGGRLSAVETGLRLELTQSRMECVAGLPADRDVVSFWARIAVRLPEDDKALVLERLPYVE